MANSNGNAGQFRVRVVNGNFTNLARRDVSAMKADFRDFRALYKHLFCTHNCLSFYKVGVDATNTYAVILKWSPRFGIMTESG